MRSCYKCKYYDEKKEFNCTKYNIIIKFCTSAEKCKYFQGKLQRRKRCNKCNYFKYSYIQNLKKYMYVCTKRKEIKAYTSLTKCNTYQKIE